MMRIKVEIVPVGDESRARTIHTLYVGNMSSLAEQSTYHAWLDYDPRVQPHNRPDPDVIVQHLRSDGALVLAKRILNRLREAT